MIGLCLAVMVLSNILGLLPLFSRPIKPDSPAYWRYAINILISPLIIVILPWTALLPLIRHVLHRHPLAKIGWRRFVGLHFAVCFLFSLAQIIIHMFFEPDRAFFHGDVVYRLVLGVYDYFGNNIIFYIGVIAAVQALTYFRQLRQKEVNEARMAETLANARLSSLKMKLQPHFIFNALQSINVLVLDKQNESASEMISRLGRLLRHSIDLDDTQMVTVKSELENVQNYLAIEEIRFKDRLKSDIYIDPDVDKAVIPSLILQPLVENSIKHGFSNKMGPGRISINIRRAGNTLKITVKNDGQALPRDWQLDMDSRFGLMATKNRLEMIYGNDFSFTVQNTGEKGVSNEIAIPFSEEILSCRREAKT